MPTDAMEALLALAGAHAVVTRTLEAQGLSFGEIRLLLALRAIEDGARPTDLARDLHLSASGVTRMALPLEKLGVVARRSDPQDARASRVVLTKAGRDLLDDAVAHVAEKGAKLLRRLSVGQTKQLQRLLEEIGR